VAGRKTRGRVNRAGSVPLASAPLKWTIPATVRTAAVEVPDGALVHPFCGASAMNPLADGANETP